MALNLLKPGEFRAPAAQPASRARARAASLAPDFPDTPADQLLPPRATDDEDLAMGEAAKPVASPRGRLRRVLQEEFHGLHLRLLLLQLLLWPLPVHAGGRLRAIAMKLAGFRLGYGTNFADLPAFSGNRALYRNFRTGAHCWFNVGCTFDLGAPISIGDHVSCGHQVIVLTSSHAIGPSGGRASGLRYRPVHIGSGTWLGARCTILPGVTIGDGAIVGAGAVVHANVPANVIVAGVPARVVKSLG